MGGHHSLLFCSTIIAHLVLRARAAPSIAFPLNSQVPPVARVSEAFEFEFLRTSFVSAASEIRYSLSKAPPWLHMDGPSRLLSGTPSASDVGPVELVLTASDDSGSADMEATLMVSADPGPELRTPLTDQLAKLGSLSDSKSLLLYPSTGFDIELVRETFSATGPDLYYYAVSSDHTPLPSWVHFDPGRLRFSGVTPPLASLIEPPQTFGISLICSDVAGFGAASADFNLVVGSHQLAFQEPALVLNVIKGVPVSFDGLREQLRLDGAPIRMEDIVTVDAQPPTWLQLDKPSLALSGTPPENVLFENFTITVKDVHRNIAKITVMVQGQTALFASGLDDVEAKIGLDFRYALPPGALKDTSIDASSETIPTAPWLHFEASKIEWSGKVPAVSPGELQVNLTLTSRATRVSESQTFKINLVDDASPLSPRSSDDTKPLPTTEGIVRGGKQGTTRSTTLCAILAPVTVVLTAAAAALCCWRARKRRGRRSYVSPSKRAISRPLPQLQHSPELAGHVKECPEDPPPRLPWPARFSGIWKSYPDLQQAQNGQAGMDTRGAIRLSSFDATEDRPATGLAIPAPVYSGALGPSRQGRAPPRPPRPDVSPRKSDNRAKRLSKTSKCAAGSIREESGHDTASSRKDDSTPASPSGRRLAGRDASRHTWMTVENSQATSHSASTDMGSVLPDPVKKQPLSSAAPASVRLVPRSESGSVSADRTKRYGYGRDGASPYFGCSPRVPSHVASRPSTWRKGKGTSTQPISTDECTIDSMLRSLTGHERDSEMHTSYPRVLSIDGKPVSRTFGSRISANLSRLSGPLSNLSPSSSLVFQRRTPSVQSGESIYSRAYSPLQDENCHRQWYRMGAGSPGRDRGMVDDQQDVEFTLEEHDHDHDQQHVEYGIASMAHRPSTPGSAAWPAALRSSSATPRLVEFRRKRPVSSGLDKHEHVVVNNSQSASVASFHRSDTGASPLGSDHKAFL